MSCVRLSATTIAPVSVTATAVVISAVRRLMNKPAILGELSPQPAFVGRNVVGQLGATQECIRLRPALQPRLPLLGVAYFFEQCAIERHLLGGDALWQPHSPRHLIALDRQPGLEARWDVGP